MQKFKLMKKVLTYFVYVLLLMGCSNNASSDKIMNMETMDEAVETAPTTISEGEAYLDLVSTKLKESLNTYQLRAENPQFLAQDSSHIFFGRANQETKIETITPLTSLKHVNDDQLELLLQVTLESVNERTIDTIKALIRKTDLIIDGMTIQSSKITFIRPE